MKRFFSVLILMSLCFCLCSCELLSHAKTETDVELPAFTLEADGPIAYTVYDRTEKVYLSVKPGNVYGTVTYTWKVSCWENFGLEKNTAWTDRYLGRDLTTPTLVVDENYTLGSSFGTLFRAECWARDTVPGSNDRSAYVVFYIYLSAEKDPDNHFTLSPDGKDTLFLTDADIGSYYSFKVIPSGAEGPITYEWYDIPPVCMKNEYYCVPPMETYSTYDLDGELLLQEVMDDTIRVYVYNTQTSVFRYICVANDGHHKAYCYFTVVYPQAQANYESLEKEQKALDDEKPNGVWPEEIYGLGLVPGV